MKVITRVTLRSEIEFPEKRIRSKTLAGKTKETREGAFLFEVHWALLNLRWVRIDRNNIWISDKYVVAREYLTENYSFGETGI